MRYIPREEVLLMRKIRRFLAAMLALLLLISSALAEASLVPHIDDWRLDTSPVQVTMSVQVNSLAEFDETRVAQLNGLLKHLTVTVKYQETQQEQWGRVGIAVDGSEALALTINERDGLAQAQLSCIGDTTYTSASGDDVAVWLLGEEVSDEAACEPGIEAIISPWLSDGYRMLDLLPNVLADFTAEKTVKTSISKMGTARIQQTITIPEENVGVLPETLASLCTDEATTAVLGSAVFSGKQVIKLWRNADGELIKATWSGQIGPDAEHLRKVSLTWTMRRDDDNTRDEITLKTPAVNGNDYNTISFKRTAKVDEMGVITLTASYSHKSRSDQTVVTRTGEAQLTSTPTSEGIQITGEITQSVTPQKEDELTLILTPDLVFAAEDVHVYGTIGMERRAEKRVLSSVTLTVDMTQGSYFDWLLMPHTIDMDSLNQNGQAAMTHEEITGAAATALIRPLVLLPYEDTLYLSDGLDEAAWAKIVNAARQATEQEAN